MADDDHDGKCREGEQVVRVDSGDLKGTWVPCDCLHFVPADAMTIYGFYEDEYPDYQDTWTNELQFPVKAAEVNALVAKIKELRDAIKEHRSQKADDRCIEDDDRLYAALGDGVKCDRRVGSKEEMLKNCARFIDRRCEQGGWPTYQELEARITKGRQLLDAAEARMAAVQREDKPRSSYWELWAKAAYEGVRDAIKALG